ncbi:hypothetical protein D9611_008302 [Ephemerocybe angulata]|uniref:Uncharacterized protein n=1 Tax=Ephemerocybe angulata TaxID=980116 RepID=A0A8H5F508_9AGAR|nr:hypothetical protein D9611_008302 [Tulosesus angulatus]
MSSHSARTTCLDDPHARQSRNWDSPEDFATTTPSQAHHLIEYHNDVSASMSSPQGNALKTANILAIPLNISSNSHTSEYLWKNWAAGLNAGCTEDGKVEKGHRRGEAEWSMTEIQREGVVQPGQGAVESPYVPSYMAPQRASGAT